MHLLGIDIGGSGIKGTLVDTEVGETLTDRYRIPTPASLMPQDVIPVVTEIVRYFDYSGPIGVGFPAVVVDGVPRTAFTAHEVKQWIGYPVAKQIAAESSCPVTLINDADAAGIAEMTFGAGVGRRGTVILLTIGTGIGSALFVDGTLVPNTEFGKIYLRNRPEVSERYLSDYAREAQGWDWEQWAPHFDEYLRYLEWLFTPQLFIIGGGASNKTDRFVPLLTTNAPIVPAESRNEAGIIGAALAALRVRD